MNESPNPVSEEPPHISGKVAFFYGTQISIVSMFPYSPISHAEQRWLFLMAGGVLTLASLPYVICAFSATPDVVFTGLLLNPADGFSYLAKMRIGLEGNWIFHLPFTLERGPGAVIFLFYLALGHFARIFDLPLIVVYHIARVVCGFALLWIVYRFIARVTDVISLRRLMWWVVAAGSGLGWVVQKFDLGFPYYYQVAILSANTFYNLISSVHGPLTVAIMLLMCMQVLQERSVSLRGILLLSILSLLLAIINPFAPLVVYLITGATLITFWWRERSFPRSQFRAILTAGLITLPLMIYMQLAVQADATLRAFSMQNQQPSPGPDGLLFAYGLLWPFAILGMRSAWQRKSDWDILLLVWIVTVIPLSYSPSQFQYRFQIGMHIPLGILAAQGLSQIIHAKWLRGLVATAMASTPLYVVLSLILSRAPVSTAVVHYPLTYISAHEAAALDWLRTTAPSSDAVLAGPEMGKFIPAFAGQRVVYGHLYETVEAPRKHQLIKDFFAGKIDQTEVLRSLAIDYVLLGPRENAYGVIDTASLPIRLVFNSGDVSVYKVELAPESRVSTGAANKWY